MTEPAAPQFPDWLETERLILRAVRVEDAEAINAAVTESFTELQPWMPWAQKPQALADTEEFCRLAMEKRAERKELGLQLRLKPDDTLVGMIGYHSIEWDVPKLEIGYWVRTPYVGRGYMTEAVQCLTQFAFESLGANRVEIRMDDRNQRSWRVAERAGYTLDGILRNDERAPSGQLRDTRIYSKVRQPDGTIT